MHAVKIGSSLTFASTATIGLVLGTFIYALISNESKRIPGVVDVSVLADSAEASVGITWRIGLLGVFVAFVAVTLVANAITKRTEP